jgi:hypothetical protein
VEGRAQYGEQTMLKQGFRNHSPELEPTFAKQQLRVIANAILDVRLQTLDMTDQDAVEKLQRAKATSPNYLGIMWAGWSFTTGLCRKGPCPSPWRRCGN